MGKLIFNYGVMAAGKSTNLLLTAEAYKRNNQKVLFFTTRTTPTAKGLIYSRCNLRTIDVKVIETNSNLVELVGDISGISCIFIDEAHELKRDQVLQLCEIADKNNVTIYCYGQRNINGHINEGAICLMSFSDELNEIKGLCWCGQNAKITTIVDAFGKIDRTFRWLVMGKDIIVTLCSKHWNEGKCKNDK